MSVPERPGGNGERATASEVLASGARVETARIGPSLEASTSFTRVGNELLIRHDGRLGVFTPLETQDESSATPGEEQNRDQIIDLLRQENARLATEKLDLEQRLDDAQQDRTRIADDFASAVQNAVDSLQTRLSRMHNATSNFAVRELSLESKVFVDVTRLGTVGFRFVKPGDEVDPALLSSLSLRIVPVPKQTQAGQFTDETFDMARDLASLSSVNETLAGRLHAQSLYTIGDLLDVGTRLRARVELASMLQIERHEMDAMLEQAELLALREMDAGTAEVLRRIQIRNLADLAEVRPEEIVRRFNAYLETSGSTLRPLEVERAELWQRAARTFSGKRPAPASDAGRLDVPVDAIKGIGTTYTRRLAERGILTVAQLRTLDDATLEEVTGLEGSRRVQIRSEIEKLYQLSRGPRPEGVPLETTLSELQDAVPPDDVDLQAWEHARQLLLPALDTLDKAVFEQVSLQQIFGRV